MARSCLVCRGGSQKEIVEREIIFSKITLNFRSLQEDKIIYLINATDLIRAAHIIVRIIVVVNSIIRPLTLSEGKEEEFNYRAAVGKND